MYATHLSRTPLGRRGHRQGMDGVEVYTNPSPARERPEHRVEVNRKSDEAGKNRAGVSVFWNSKSEKQGRNVTPTEGHR